MKIETQFTENHEARLTVEVDPSQLEANKRRAAAKLASRLKIPGFRPGKAPYAVILRQVGEGAILEDALELVIDEIYSKMIEESGIHPYGPGQLEKVASMDPMTLEFIVPLQAEITLGDYRLIRRPYELPVVSEKDIQEVLDRLRENQAIIEPVERPAQEGDQVTVRISANRKQVEENQQPLLIREQSIPVVVKPLAAAGDDGEAAADDDEKEWPYVGFSQHLVGMAAGDEKVVDYQYPQSESSDLLRGVEAEFHLVVENVKSRQLAELDDEFARSLGEFETVDVLLDNIRQTLESQTLAGYNQQYDQQILEEALQQVTVKYSPPMLERETDDVIEEFKRRLERQRYDIDLYLKSRDMSMDDLREEMKPAAKSRLKQNLFLLELGKVEGVRVSPAELEQESMATMQYLSRVLPEKELQRLSNQDAYQSVVSNVFVDLLSRRSMDCFRDICSGKLEQAEVKLAEQEENVLEAAETAETPAFESQAADTEEAAESAPENPETV